MLSYEIGKMRASITKFRDKHTIFSTQIQSNSVSNHPLTYKSANNGFNSCYLISLSLYIFLNDVLSSTTVNKESMKEKKETHICTLKTNLIRT